MDKTVKSKKYKDIFIGKTRNYRVDTHVNTQTGEVTHYDTSHHDPNEFTFGVNATVYTKRDLDKDIVDTIKSYSKVKDRSSKMVIKEVRSERQFHRKYADGPSVYQDFNTCVCGEHTVYIEINPMSTQGFWCSWVNSSYGCKLNVNKLFPQANYLINDILIVRNLSKLSLKELATRRELKFKWFYSRVRLVNLIVQNILN